MKMLHAAQIRQADAYTIANLPISSIDLMEKAARACTDTLLSEFPKTTNFLVLAGIGNNGGDGLAMARQLVEAGKDVAIVVCGNTENGSEDFKINLRRCRNMGLSTADLNTFLIPQNSTDTIVIDAILGSGLQREVTGELAEFIRKINESNLNIVSIDMPSGLYMEDNRRNEGAIVKAGRVYSFHCPKLSLLLPENEKYCSDFKVIDIGLMREFTETLSSKYTYFEIHDAVGLLKKRVRFSHKGNFGHAWIMAGATGKMGAAVLSTRACLRVGAGLVTAAVPSAGTDILQTAVPEAMVWADPNNDFATHLPPLDNCNAICAGPGWGQNSRTANVLLELLNKSYHKLLLDADAINLLADSKVLKASLPANTILTPHPGEFDRLCGKSDSHMERIEKALLFCKKYRCIMVLKGAHTAVISQDGNVSFNSTGNPGMATAGSGDVLSGIITGLLAQGYTPQNAAKLGVWLHGKAGDTGRDAKGEFSLLAGDIIDHISAAFAQLTSLGQ